jgi:phosphoribosylformylglycinamidine cyclo-ligase
VPELGTSIGEALLVPHRSYLRVITPILEAGDAIKGMAHITGGGITDNLPRVLPEGTDARVRVSAWTVPPIFGWLQRAGGVPHDDMLRTFNMGIGMILVVAPEEADAVLGALAAAGEADAVRIGEIAAGRGQVVYN